MAAMLTAAALLVDENPAAVAMARWPDANASKRCMPPPRRMKVLRLYLRFAAVAALAQVQEGVVAAVGGRLGGRGDCAGRHGGGDGGGGRPCDGGDGGGRRGGDGHGDGRPWGWWRRRRPARRSRW
jgi:hypothetical protein